MIRASLSAHNRLVREQQQRRKRETSHDVAGQDEQTRLIAAQAMLSAVPEPAKLAPALKIDTKYHAPKNETFQRHPQPAPERSPASRPTSMQRCAPPGQTGANAA